MTPCHNHVVADFGEHARTSHLSNGSVKLVGLGDDHFHAYSLGMRQRPRVGYAMLGDPEIVCLDEPPRIDGLTRGTV